MNDMELVVSTSKFELWFNYESGCFECRYIDYDRKIRWERLATEAIDAEKWEIKRQERFRINSGGQ
jgi:hypothetical protein